MGILDRINLLVRSNVNELMNRSDSPERTLDRSIQDMQGSIGEARAQLRVCEQNEARLLRQWERAREEALQWEDRAMQALRDGDESRARAHLVEKQRVQTRAEGLKRELEQQREYMADLNRSLDALQVKLDAARDSRRSFRSHLTEDRRDAPPPAEGGYTFPSFSDSAPPPSRGAAPPPSYSSPPPSYSSPPPSYSSPPSRPRSGDRSAFVFDEDLRREYPEEVFGAGETFAEFERIEGRVHRDAASASAAIEVDGILVEDPLRDDLEDRFRSLTTEHETRTALNDLKRRGDDPPRERRPSSPPAASAPRGDIDAIKRQLSEDIDW